MLTECSPLWFNIIIQSVNLCSQFVISVWTFLHDSSFMVYITIPKITMLKGMVYNEKRGSLQQM